jgi:hypothetical protein
MIDVVKTALSGELHRLLNRFTCEAAEDYIGLWQIVDAIKSKASLIEGIDGDLRSAVTGFVYQMLQHGFVAVDLTLGGGCTPWADQRSTKVIQRIEDGWSKLGRDPTIGELAWFDKPNRTKLVSSD